MQPREGQRIEVTVESGGKYRGRVSRKFRGYNLNLRRDRDGMLLVFGKHYGPDWRIVKWRTLDV